jgi:hypothetical protein
VGDPTIASTACLVRYRLSVSQVKGLIRPWRWRTRPSDLSRREADAPLSQPRSWRLLSLTTTCCATSWSKGATLYHAVLLWRDAGREDRASFLENPANPILWQGQQWDHGDRLSLAPRQKSSPWMHLSDAGGFTIRPATRALEESQRKEPNTPSRPSTGARVCWVLGRWTSLAQPSTPDKYWRCSKCRVR